MRLANLAAGTAILALASAAAGQCSTFTSPFGTDLNGSVRALATWTPPAAAATHLVAGGLFTAHDSFPCDYVGYWDGAAWRAFGWGTDGAVNALTTWDPDGAGPATPQAVAAGSFIFAGADSTGSIVVNRIARWDGAAWRALGTGVNGDVKALTTWDPDGSGPQSPLLIAGGSFTHASGTWVDYIAAWDGVSWRALGWGLDGAVNVLTTWDADGAGPANAQLVAAGVFTHAGADSTGEIVAGPIAAWNGTVWTSLGGFSPVRSMISHDFDASGERTPALVVTDGATRYRESDVWRSLPALAEPAPGGPTPAAFSLASWDIDGAGQVPAQLFTGGRESETMPIWIKGQCQPCFITTHYWNVARWTGNSWVTQAGFRSNMVRADVLTTWDADGAGPGIAMLVAGGADVPYLRARAAFPFPIITQQPQSVTVRVGGSATFSLIETNGATSFRWYKTGLVSGAPNQYATLINGLQASGSFIAGATSNTLTISNVQISDSGRGVAHAGNPIVASLKCVVFGPCEGETTNTVQLTIVPCSADYNNDGDGGTDADIEAFFACLGGACCTFCNPADFNGDGDTGTDADIEAFFRVLAGGKC